MPHPKMFHDDDFGLAEVREIALGFPEAFEKVSHGRPVFCAPKMFAIYGGSTRESGEMVTVPSCLLFKADDADRTALERDERTFHPAYLGPYGWLGLDFSVAEVDWEEVGELVDASFRLVASKKLIVRLDER
ncbi:MmcQ/YjbR family DNA-binding protein [Mycolicibacterium sediminis]|uniref:MmcQ/YjbR family DNA-binding protein n=1 Tax=Mycolicibacterium sediminis TaxID=1286180 RepID=UPI0015774899|nr:MmcQ/YjbR family DNA-binding protein [Mycolicibacterium sediminis]